MNFDVNLAEKQERNRLLSEKMYLYKDKENQPKLSAHTWRSLYFWENG